MRHRILSNLLTTRWSLRRAFPRSTLQAIERAIGDSEVLHGGELRFAIETALDVPSLVRGVTARDRAVDAFAQLRTWDTADNSGVLIYVLLAEHDIEIVADRGYTGKITSTQWQQVCHEMEQAFRAGQFEEGALCGIRRITELIGSHFPPLADNPNELPDHPVTL